MNVLQALFTSQLLQMLQWNPNPYYNSYLNSVSNEHWLWRVWVYLEIQRPQILAHYTQPTYHHLNKPWTLPLLFARCDKLWPPNNLWSMVSASLPLVTVAKEKCQHSISFSIKCSTIFFLSFVKRRKYVWENVCSTSPFRALWSRWLPHRQSTQHVFEREENQFPKSPQGGLKGPRCPFNLCPVNQSGIP